MTAEEGRALRERLARKKMGRRGPPKPTKMGRMDERRMTRGQMERLKEMRKRNSRPLPPAGAGMLTGGQIKIAKKAPPFNKINEKETADYSAITTWGIFQPAEGYEDCIILLDAIKGRFDFPDLKNVALEQYQYWQPETTIIEAKASGQPLIHELRRAGIPVIDYVPARGRDKHTRINSVAPIFESGMVFAPTDEKSAQDVIEEVAAFPHGQFDDYVDSMTQAVIRFREGGFVTTYSDAIDEPNFKIEKDYRYYG